MAASRRRKIQRKKTMDTDTPIRDRYKILDRVGNGAFGQVYRIKDKLTLKQYAMKTIRVGRHGIPENPFREIKAMQELCPHPHVRKKRTS